MAKTIKLSNGRDMPTFGLGTWQSSADEVKAAVRVAIDAGYRMIDTAYTFFNEAAIGEVLEEYIKAGKIKREDIFVTTKLASIYTRQSDVKQSLTESLKKLRLDYVDLFLIHTPISFQNTGDPNNILPIADGKILFDETVEITDVWKAMEDMVDEQKTKSIGLTNFNSKQVDSICKVARIQPVVNQVECHAYFPQYELQKFCGEKGIRIMAYGPLGSPGRGRFEQIQLDQTPPVLLEDQTIVDIANKYKKTPAQIVLRNLVQRGIIVTPKSVNPSNIQSNIQIYDFELTSENMEAISKINKGFRMFDTPMFKESKGYPFGIAF